MKKIPRLQRARRGKKYLGSYFVFVDGERVNLDTKNATLALERAREAADGRRNFQSDSDAAADATEEAVTAQTPSAPAAPASQALAPIPAPTETPAPPPPVVDPPQATPTGDWAADAQAAAEETKQESDSAEPAADPGVKVQIDPNVLEQMYKTIAEFVVEGQLAMQGKLVEWKTGTKPPPLAVFFEQHPQAPDMMVNGVKTSRELSVTLWTQFLRRKFPIDDLPDWGGALLLTGGLVSVQYVAAKVTEEETKRSGATPRRPDPVVRDAEVVGSDNGAGAEAL